MGKGDVKPVYCHPVYLTYMQSISCKIPGWRKHKLESRFPGEISITSDMQSYAEICRDNLRYAEISITSDVHHPYGRK